MKKSFFKSVMWQGLALSALAIGFAACEPSEKPCPNKKEADTTDQGVTVLLEMEDVTTGNTTKTTLRADNYSFTDKGGDGDVQVGGTGFYPKTPGTNDINVGLTYYAKQDIVFQGWSWRYIEDKKGFHRGNDGDAIEDYLPLAALQTEEGVQKLDLTSAQTSFVCKYDPNKQNKVLVKVRYKREKALKFPPKIPVEKFITESTDFMREIIKLTRQNYMVVQNNLTTENGNRYNRNEALYRWSFLPPYQPQKFKMNNGFPDPGEILTIKDVVSGKSYSVSVQSSAKLEYYNNFTKPIVDNLRGYYLKAKRQRDTMRRDIQSGIAVNQEEYNKLNKMVTEAEKVFAQIDPIVQMWEDFPPLSFGAADPSQPK